MIAISLAGIERFIDSRRERWHRLAKMLDRCEAGDNTGLDRDGLQELVRLYRQVSSDLNQARTLTANPAILNQLNQLVGRAYRWIYRGASRRRAHWSLRRFLPRFLLHEVPATMRARRGRVLTAAAVFAIGALFGLIAVLVDVGNARALIPGEFLAESPRQRVEHIESKPERIADVKSAAEFGAQLYTHNIQVSFLAFAAGALTIVGAWLLLFYNGMLLGVVAATYLLDGVGTFFVAWVGPHGVLELPAIIIAAAAGLVVGEALLIPGERGRAQALRDAYPAATRMIAVTIVSLIAAGLIEGSFSQFSAKTVPYGLKIAVAAALFTALCSWLFVGRRGEEA